MITPTTDDPTRAVLDAVLDVYTAMKNEDEDAIRRATVLRMWWPELFGSLDRLVAAVEGHPVD